MSEHQVACYYRQVFDWERLGNFVTLDQTLAFHQVCFKFIYYGDPDKWSKWRYFASVWALKDYVLTSFNNPHRKPIVTINYGAVAQERFLTFDIDLNDYGTSRNVCCTCGTDKQACAKCWNLFMAHATIPFLKRVLSDMWDFQDVSYVFSGRRGLHVHVRAPRALRMTAQQRARVLDSFQQVDMSDIAWPLVEDLMKTQQSAGLLFDVMKQCNPLEGGYFGGHDDLTACCTYLKEHTSQATFDTWKEGVCRALFSPRFDVGVTTGVTHACKVPETLHQVTLNVCKTFKEGVYEFQVWHVSQYIF